jgi:dTDP-glucose 4,6-dehydratase
MAKRAADWWIYSRVHCWIEMPRILCEMDDMRKTQTILVTGGLGAIGTLLVPELRRRGHRVSVMDLPHSSVPDYYRGDVAEYRQFQSIVVKVKPELVYHLAAEFGRWNGEAFYETMWRANVVGTKHMLTLARECGYRSVVFSSSEVYGEYEGEMHEDVMTTVPIRQMNDYAISKWVNELQTLNEAAMHGVEVVRVRLFNTYGPGEKYSEYRSVICKFCYLALAGKPFPVYRGHRRTSTYIEDCVHGLAGIADNFKPGEVYNIASDEEHSIEDAAKLVLKATGADAKLAIYKEPEAFTTKEKKVNAEKARRDLGMRTTVRLPEGIARTVAWMREHYPFDE